MLHIFASIGTPASTAIQQATSGSNLHFEVTIACISAGAAVMGYFIKRLITENDTRYQGLATELHTTNDKLSEVAEGLANLTGQLAGAEKANVAERRRVQTREPAVVTAAAEAKNSAEQAALAVAETSAKLDEIHALVNSDKTASMQGELDSTRRELLLLKAIPMPDEAAKAAIDAAHARIAELEVQLADRRSKSP